ncbi:AMP-binding protein [Aureimonas sp. AU12]|uniref:AMP-binding protein n=1 Tax=Aureimonas sp. AU12 TaxID=1638161 RepID=UPI000784882A|nr:AMP-binding protein [Aureimonas sp. AU12]
MTGFREARDFLLTHREDYDAARRGFRWPDAVPFNWALDWFDRELAGDAETRDALALRIIDQQRGTDLSFSFREMSDRSGQTANVLRAAGLRRGDRLLLLLGNEPALWETMLAAFKLGVVVIPATVLLTADELADRIERGGVAAVVTDATQANKVDDTGFQGLRILADAEARPSWMPLSGREDHDTVFEPDGPTQPDDPMLLYFTSGTTAKPKLVLHTHRSYPVGALSTLYWLGLKPGDRHLNVSSPGWAKHAWSSFFAPWNAGAAVIVVNQARFDARALLGALDGADVTTLCAPPTVWRHLVQEDLGTVRHALRELCAAGEPLNPEVIERVRQAWGLTIRDGYGQTETTAQVANTPGQRSIPGSMGQPLPGYQIAVVDPDGRPAREGEVCIVLGSLRPAGLMAGYLREGGEVTGTEGELYRTGDVAFYDEAGGLTFVGRADDVFKSSDYRISPFELESVLVEHPAVREAAVVPMPDALRLSVPRAFVALAGDALPDVATARSIFEHAARRLAPFKRIRHLVFVLDLPKTVSGKIRRVELRRRDVDISMDDNIVVAQFSEKDVA